MELSSFECIEMAVFNTATLTGSYQVLNGSAQQTDTGSIGFENDIKILKFYNDGTTGITISYNGVKKMDFLPSKATLIVDLQANHADNSSYSSGEKVGRKGQLVWGLGTAGTGNLYISGYR